MKCVCGYDQHIQKWFKTQTTSSDGYSNIIARREVPNEYIGSIDFFICPSCGLVYSDVRGRIERSV